MVYIHARSLKKANHVEMFGLPSLEGARKWSEASQSEDAFLDGIRQWCSLQRHAKMRSLFE